MREESRLKKGRGGKNRENDGGINLTYIVSTYVNITMCSPVQLLYANNFFKKERTHTCNPTYLGERSGGSRFKSCPGK
jgi:hypothetical protein